MCIRDRYYTDGSWTGEFLYFQNAEAERASGDAGFLFSSGGNNANNSGGHHGIVIGANVSDVYIAGGRCGGNASLSGNGAQTYGIRIDNASHNNIRIIGVNCTGNATGGIDASLSGSGNKIQFNSGSALSVNT